MSVYGIDLRRKIVTALQKGDTVASVARRFCVDEKTVRSYRRRAAEGRLHPDRSGPKRHTKLTDADLQTLRERIKAQPDITLRELQRVVSVRVAESTICRTLKKLGLSFKKNH